VIEELVVAVLAKSERSPAQHRRPPGGRIDQRLPRPPLDQREADRGEGPERRHPGAEQDGAVLAEQGGPGDQTMAAPVSSTADGQPMAVGPAAADRAHRPQDRDREHHGQPDGRPEHGPPQANSVSTPPTTNPAARPRPAALHPATAVDGPARRVPPWSAGGARPGPMPRPPPPAGRGTRPAATPTVRAHRAPTPREDPEGPQHRPPVAEPVASRAATISSPPKNIA
jgi:hypothetical protein